ncbi:MAG: DUF3795 domain-containing protein [Spirochaetaceae bacterium]|nr:DUF3795 domain-containing protein [Spirochaetaceae bacterium]
METKLAVCGLDCALCPAFVATKANDLAALTALAEQWGRQFNISATPEQIRCHGCDARDGVQIGHCAECAMRLCALGRGFTTCAECGEFGCDKTAGFFKDVPEAKARLEALRQAR